MIRIHFLGNAYSDNKPKREVFNGDLPQHVNDYKPFQFNDGKFTHLPAVEQPHINRHHHENHEGKQDKKLRLYKLQYLFDH